MIRIAATSVVYNHEIRPQFFSVIYALFWSLFLFSIFAALVASLSLPSAIKTVYLSELLDCWTCWSSSFSEFAWKNTNQYQITKYY